MFVGLSILVAGMIALRAPNADSRAIAKAPVASVQTAQEVDSATKTVSPIRGHTWPCAPNPADLPRLIRLIESLEDDRTPDSVVNIYTDALQRKRAINVDSRNILTVLKVTPGLLLVKVSTSKPFPLAYQRKTAESCWVTAATIGSAQ